MAPPRNQKETPGGTDDEDEAMMDGKDVEDEDTSEDFKLDGTVLEFHQGKQNLSLVLFKVKKVYNISGATEGVVVRAAVADKDNYTTTVFFAKEIEDREGLGLPKGEKLDFKKN